MTAYPVMPGLPAAGHVSAKGFWHPGSVEGCVRCEEQPAFKVDRRGVRYVERGKRPPAFFRDPVTCGTCGRTWDDAHVTGVTPAPSARCPFEGLHR